MTDSLQIPGFARVVKCDRGYSFQQDLDLIVSQVKAFAPLLSGKTILLTGGTGFVGKWIVYSLVELSLKMHVNLTIVLLTRNRKRFLSNNAVLANYSFIQFIESDIRSFRDHPGPIDYIIHAAADVSPNGETNDPLQIADTIVSGTKHILDLADRKQVAKMIFLSSGAVYGVHDRVAVTEGDFGNLDCLSAANYYAEGKRMAENYCALYVQQYRLPVVIARCFSFLGPFLPMNAQFAAGNFIHSALSDDAIRVQGDGTSVRSYLYSADLVVWLMTILLRGKTGEAYNVGSDDPVSIHRLAETVANCFVPGVPVVIEGRPEPGKKRIYVPSIQKAKDDLGLRIHHSLEESVEKTLLWYRQYLSLSR